MKKVVKFGGSSLASAEQFKKVGDIIRADKSRRYVVPSAPGKRSSSDTKVTDMLYSCYNLAIREKKFTSLLDEIHARYNEIIDGLNLELSLDHEFDMIRENFGKKIGRDYAASRGEYLNGIIMANYLGFCFIDAAEVIRFHEDGSLDDEKTNELLSLRLEGEEFAVIPGFYGAKEDGTIVTGKTSSLLGASAAVLLNAIKVLGEIPHDTHLIAPSAIEPIQTLKTTYLGSKNPRLHTDEVLIALSMSAATDETAKKALAQLPKLRGCQVHTSVMLSNVDIKTFKKLGVQLTSEPVYEHNKLYH